MCIAIASMKGNSLPSEEFLKNCFKNNPDGAGFAFNYNGRVQIRKGFMDFESFKESLEKHDKMFDLKNCGVLIHFRIKTHGKVSVGCCHPFPVTAKLKKLRKGSCECGHAVIHNGVISLTTSKTDDMKSDTMVFIMEYLTHIASNAGWSDNDQNIKLIEKLIGSKMAILDGNGNIKMTSGFTQDEDGNYYSNQSYKPDYRKYTYTSSYTYDDKWWAEYRKKYIDNGKHSSAYYEDDDDYYNSAYYNGYYGGGYKDYRGTSDGQKALSKAEVIDKCATSAPAKDCEQVKDDANDQYYQDLIYVAGCYGISEEQIVALKKAGYTFEELEDYVYNRRYR